MHPLFPRFFFLFVSLVFLLSSCGPNDCQKLEAEVRKMLVDNTIDQEEWNSLKGDMVEKERLLTREGCYQSDDAGLRGLIRLVADKRRNAGEGEISIFTEGKTNKPQKLPRFSFYLESSASMFPYAKSNSSFKNAIYDLLTRIPENRHEENKMFYISTAAVETKGGVREFIETDDPYDIARKDPRIKTGSTDINEIFKLLLDEGNSDRISILVSDCIYSIQGKSALSDLDKLKFLTKDIFQNKVKDYSVLVLQLESAYEGTYYDYTNTRHAYSGNRPYYMIFIGKASLMDRIFSDPQMAALSNFKTLKGFKNYYLFTPGGNESIPHFSILPGTNKKGEYRTDRDLSATNYVKGITEAKPRRRNDENEFQLSIAVDLTDILAGEAYKRSPGNYIIEADDNFEIVEILDAVPTNFASNDKRYVGTATHILVVKADKIGVQEQALKISLKKSMAEWILASSTSDDRKILEDPGLKDKTFGLNYMLEGIDKAYHPVGESKYFTISLSVKK